MYGNIPKRYKSTVGIGDTTQNYTHICILLMTNKIKSFNNKHAIVSQHALISRKLAYN